MFSYVTFTQPFNGSENSIINPSIVSVAVTLKFSLNMLGISNEQLESNPFLKDIYTPEMFNIMLNPQMAPIYKQMFSSSNGPQNNNQPENIKNEKNKNEKNKNENMNGDIMEKMEDLYYKEVYKEQLEILKNMGFNDEQKNLKALIEFNGDINDVLDL